MLCTLAELKDYLNIQPTVTGDDVVLLNLINARSADFLREINRTDFAPAAAYTEIREGDGAGYMALAHYPINSITQVAKQTREPAEARSIPADPGPYTVQVAHHATFVADQGVVWADGSGALTYTSGSPGAGQYSVAPTTGIYTFNAGDQGKAIKIAYDWNNPLPASTGQTAGYRIDLSLDPERRWELFLQGLVFEDEGIYAVVYNAGYGDTNVDNEPWNIPADPGPYTLTPIGRNRFTLDRGVKFQPSGTSLVKVSGSPTTGQYVVSADGIYTFSADDTGLLVGISYATLGVPDDVQHAVKEWAAYTSKVERQMTGQTSRHLAQGETVSVQQIVMPLNTARAIDKYRRCFPPRERHDASGVPVPAVKGSQPTAVRTQDEFGL
jgi:hypothetical protein